MTGPDFICIGAIKGGTTWLYDQARAHPDCWMTPIKEIHYFNRARFREFPQRALARLMPLAEHKASNARDAAFFAALGICEGHDADTALYAQLFDMKGDKKSGDVSPGYACLPEEFIAQIARDLPDVKILYMARGIIDRAWSHISMRWRQGDFNARALRSEGALRRYLDARDMQQASFPSRTIPLWARHFGPERFRIFDFEQTARDAHKQRADIFSFIGLDPAKGSEAIAPDHNHKKGRAKFELTEERFSWLHRYFADEIDAWFSAQNDTLKPWCAPPLAEIPAI